jgi:hypothetical protein
MIIETNVIQGIGAIMHNMEFEMQFIIDYNA